MRNSMVMLIFFKNTVFGQIWSKNLKLLFSFEIWYLDKFEYAEFNDDADLFYFRPQVLVLGKFGPTSIHYFELKFGSNTKSDRLNSMVMLTFSVLNQKYTFLGKSDPKKLKLWFWAKIWSKSQSCHFELKFGSKINLNMQNQRWCSPFHF